MARPVADLNLPQTHNTTRKIGLHRTSKEERSATYNFTHCAPFWASTHGHHSQGSGNMQPAAGTACLSVLVRNTEKPEKVVGDNCSWPLRMLSMMKAEKEKWQVRILICVCKKQRGRGRQIRSQVQTSLRKPSRVSRSCVQSWDGAADHLTERASRLAEDDRGFCPLDVSKKKAALRPLHPSALQQRLPCSLPLCQRECG